MPTTLRTDNNDDEPADDQTRLDDHDDEDCECVEEYDLECARCAIANGGPLVGEEDY